MLIEVNIESCMEHGITVSEYAFLQLLWQKKNKTAALYLEVDPVLKRSMPRLSDKGFIIWNGKSIMLVRPKCNEVFGLSDDTDFWEFFNTFPLKVSSNGTSRALRASDPASKNALEARSKYKARIKTKTAHRHVMACLNAELEEKVKSKKLGFMQNILTWLNQNTWQLHEYLLKSEKPKAAQKYGEGLV